MIQKIRNNVHGAFKHKKGFTLVEVIVVLVILAILAAILVPKLIGWIDQSKDKAATGEGHLVLSALQADCSEQYGNRTGTFTYTKNATNVTKYLSGDVDADNITSATGDATGKITGFTYTASNGKTVTYTYSGTKGSFEVK